MLNSIHFTLGRHCESHGCCEEPGSAADVQCIFRVLEFVEEQLEGPCMHVRS